MIIKNINGIPDTPVNNVSIENGRQIIEIQARGGYRPRITNAKSGLPTTIRVKTNGTFDCSAGLTVPSLNYKTFLPSTGSTEIEIPAQGKGALLRGLCQMGMYDFRINFD